MKNIASLLLVVILGILTVSTSLPAQDLNPVVYAALYDEGNIGVINPLNGKLIQRIQVGRHPDAVVLNAASTRLFVCNSGEITVSVVDIPTNRVAQVLRLPILRRGITAGAMTHTPDGKTIYVAERSSTDLPLNVYAIDVEREMITGQFEAGPSISAMSVSHDGARLFIVHQGRGISVFNTGTMKKEKDIPTLEGMTATVTGVACSPTAPKAYVSYGTANMIQIINTASLEVTGKIAMPKYHTGSQFDVLFSPDGARAFVINRRTNLKEVDGINVIRSSDDAVIKLFNSGNIMRGMFVTPDNKSFYVASADLKWYNLESLEHIKSISLKTQIAGIAVIFK